MSINISNTFGKQNKLIIFIIIICYFKLYLFIFGTRDKHYYLIFFYTFGEGGNIYILFIYLRVLLMIIVL